MSPAKILVVDDEPDFLEILSDELGDEGYRVLTAASGKEAIAQVRREEPGAVLLDIKMPDIDGIEVLSRIKQWDKNISVIIITAYGTMDTVIEAMDLGAYDYITKPFDLGKLKVLIRRALEARMLAREVNSLRSELKEKYSLENIVGKNSRMYEVYKRIGKVVGNKATVLIRGETGTGKELVARAIHFNGLLKNGPFIAIDCASLPQDLLESELFGHERGAFTGAVAQKPGKFELAHGGTLFLDEIGNLTLTTQAKLLRVLQEKKIERLGGTRSIEIDVRIIAATNKDLEKAVKEGSFREDLYYRLNVVLIHLPPLRERKDDIPLLVEHFLQKFKSESRGKLKYIPRRTMDLLLEYDWPGNVRELENVMETAVVMGKAEAILIEDLPPEIQELAQVPPLDVAGKISLEQRVANFEKELIISALEQANWIQVKAAELLGTTRRIMRYKMQKYDIKRKPNDGRSRKRD